MDLQRQLCGLRLGLRGTQGRELVGAVEPKSQVKKVIAVVSGKGGVGKSTVTAQLAVAMSRKREPGRHSGRRHHRTVDPQGIRRIGAGGRMHPAYTRPLTKSGIQVMSMNLLLDCDTDPVLWRGPVIAGAVKQFWTDVIWEDVDYLFVDMPPGTGDVPLTVFQSIPVDGIVVVTSPQALVSMIVTKAVKMANMMHVPVLGFVENYSYFTCPDCGKRLAVFGESKLDEAASAFDIPVLARLPVDPAVARAFDEGRMECVEPDGLSGVIEAVEKMSS